MPTRRNFISAALGAPALHLAAATDAPPNVLLMTVDDMNWDTPGCFGGRVPGITPNIDRLAAEGMRFERAHVTVAVCQPSRSALMTGRYPHRNGAEGFNPIREDVPTLQERLRAAGYRNGIFAKVEHLAPRPKFCWDTVVEAKELRQGRAPELYGSAARDFFAKAKAGRTPFFLMANSQDPNRPFAGSAQELKNFKEHLPYSRRIDPSEAIIPGFLPDIPDVRQEVSEYLTSAKRADETTGAVLRSLAASGLAENTLVIFLSDNGMSFPYSKTNCYFNSTRTPWIVRWPGRVKPGAVNRQDFISGIDFTPTVLDAARLAPLEGVDGGSFLRLLGGGHDSRRVRVHTVFHETSGKQRFEMRAVQDARFGYIWNAWSDGKRIFRNESQAGLTFAAMRASTDPAVQERVRFFQYRTPEELYDFAADPNGLRNLAADHKFSHELVRMRTIMRRWMRSVADPLMEAFPST